MKIARIIPLIFGGVGVIILAFGIRSLKEARISAQWPATDGRIISSRVERHVSRSSSSGNTSVTYGADITYDYVVDGHTYEGSRVAVGDIRTSNRSRAERIVERYAAGTPVEVFYNPDDPSRAVLEAGLQSQAFLLPGLGSAFILFSIIFLVLSARGPRSKSG